MAAAESKKSGKQPGGEKLIATNPNARSNYFIQEVVEAGLVLVGTEIKSMREQSPNLRDSFVEVRRKAGSIEGWLLNAHIAPYTHGNIWNHDPLRQRKLLLHKRQLERMYGANIREGMTIVPTRIYLKNGRAKIELALAKGKKKHDKREDIKKKSADREMQHAQKQARKR